METIIAPALYRQALTMNRKLYKPANEATCPEGIAEHRLTTSDARHGAERMHPALEIYQRLGMRADADRVATRLADPAVPHTAASAP